MDRGTHFDVKSMKFVLSMFRESLLVLTHAYMLAMFYCFQKQYHLDCIQ